NFARPGFAARHNQGYWLHTPYLGLGPGAASFRDGMRWWNVRVLRHYVARALEQRLPIGGEETLQRDDLMLEYVMLRLRLLERGLSEAQFQRRFGLPLRMVFPGVVERL